METPQRAESGEDSTTKFAEQPELAVAVRIAARELGDTLAGAIHDSSSKLADAMLSTGKMLLRGLVEHSPAPQNNGALSLNAVYARKNGGRPMSEKTEEEVASLERMRARKKPGSDK